MKIGELAWADEAWDRYVATESADLPLYRALNRILILLAQSGNSPELRARRLQGSAAPAPALWAVPVRTANADWLVLWNRADDGCPQVHYVGPDPTA